ncbi:phosphoglycolate phosphatase [Halorubrum alkaliphilum]|uniref:Phosphoglycolate phosphatase n=1 Tax=Halorubrum alkaliphilum TaxID=261290 RepID=A0A8T4GGC9_9EURY|nr:HAD-IA family hydrolase [Halorubrum alkaliphilum]MBP1922232.1 phosphoglycolate phosphatase [Halorubrum alkaliphilum]
MTDSLPDADPYSEADTLTGADGRVGSDAFAAADAVVYDLDGTLLELAVDWDRVAEDVTAAYAQQALIPPTEDLWKLLDAAEEYGIAAAVEEAIAAHEREGAADSRPFPLGERLLSREDTRPAAVCSLNCEAACRIALETHGLDDAVDAVVGRDSVGTHKPDPEPLLAAIDAIDADPDRTVFVGDSASDGVTAERAGVAFVSVADALADNDI